MSMAIPAERVMTRPLKSGSHTKRPEYDLPSTRGDKLELPPLITEIPLSADDRPTIVDLFCGAGGMSLGFEAAGFSPLLGVDRDRWACQTFAANVPAKTIVQDLQAITDFRAFFAEQGIRHVTGIVGGPPCQGFSRVGRDRIRHRDRLKGYNEPRKDPRNRLYRQFLAAVAALRPPFFVMENVPDLALYEDEGRLLIEQIQEEFEALDYYVKWDILPASHFGVPQKRKRLFIVGFHHTLGKPFQWFEHETYPTFYGVHSLRMAIGDLPVVPDGHLVRLIPYTVMPDTWLHHWYRARMPEGLEHMLFDHLTRPHREDDKRYFRKLEEGQKYIDLPEEDRRYRSDIFRDKYHKLIWDEPSWTLTAHISHDTYRYIHPDREPPRTLSLREVARIQSFPDRWRFCGYRTNAFTQIGNAVPPLLARVVARHILAQIRGEIETPDPLVVQCHSVEHR
jgi:DNA (cytosine-5)-methyltransferase 1